MPVRLERLIRIYNRLRRGPVTVEIISKWAKGAGITVSDRQLYRDLATLKDLQIAAGENVVEFSDEKNKKTWKLEYDDASEAVTQYDINSFFLFRNFIPVSIQQHRKESFEKFEQILYRNLSRNKYQKQIEANELYLKRTNYKNILYGETEHQFLEDLIWALHHKRVIQILSNDVNASNIDLTEFPYPLKLQPFEMLFHDGQVLIAGVEAATGKLLIYLINDDFSFQLTNEIFDRKRWIKKYNEQRTARFGITEPVGNKVYCIKLEFAEGYGLAMRKNFLHHTAVWKKLKNGNDMLQIKCSITRELIGFLGFSLDKVKVHAPKALKDLVLKKFGDTMRLYEGDDVDEARANEDY